MKRLSLIFSLVFLSPLASLVAEETVLQYFNTSWKEIEYRLPEIAEAGYTSLWLPPPTKGGSGTYSVGYDVFDRFDLGDKDQSGTVRTRYGTKAELLSLVEKAHRFGLKVYFDNVMAHNAGPLDNVPAGTLFPGIPGFVPEDFHLVRKVGGGWRKASDSVDYNDEWQVLNRNPFAWDIAYEDWNTSFDPVGQTENLDYPKWIGIRHAGKPWLYLDTDLKVATNADGQDVHPFSNKEPYVDSGYGAGNTGAGNGKFDWQDTNTNGQHDVGEPSEPFTDTGVDPTNPARQTAAWGYGNGKYDMGNIVAEDVNTMVIRSIRWQVDQTNCDGFRLDAVKHVPNYFFGLMSGTNKDRSNAGFLGQAQEQFNVTRGFTDWDNLRDSSFDSTLARNDLLFFGEHLGAPPNPDDYINAGMRLANDDFANGVGNGIGGSLSGYDNPGSFTKGVNTGMMYTLSHDNNYMAGSERPAAHHYMLMRAGLPIIYTDGYNISGGPDYFPKPSYVPFLGQYGQNYITGALRVRRDFVRGGQFGRWSNQNFAAWEFRDKTENTSMNDADGTTLLVLMARNYTSGQGQPGGFTTSLPTNTILRNYSPHGGSFYAYVGNDGKIKELDGAGNFTANQVITPSNGYFAFAVPVPEATLALEGSTVRPITIQQNGVDCEMMNQPRVDGKNGDPAYAYTAQIPRVTSATNLSILSRGDGSVANMLIKLDGGVDVNSQLSIGPLTGTKRDNPPDTLPADPKGMEVFVGYEQMQFERRMTEKFAAQDVSRVIIGSPGAETWEATIGSGGITLNQADVNGTDTNTDTAQWLFHNPAAGHGIDTTLQMQPQPASAAGQPITFVVKVGYTADALGSVKIYYTTDGTSYPEGSGNKGRGSTQIVNFTKVQNGTAEAGGTPEWWRGTIPALPAGTKLRYKIGGYKTNAAPRSPSSMDEVRKKERMETIYQITGFNANTVTYYPHNDKGTQSTGLKEGMHVVRTRSFLSRSGKASLYKTNTQTFYLDQQAPQGLIKFPANNGDTLGGSSYGFVVLSDDQTNEVWYQILDTNGTTTWAKATEVNPPQQIGGTSYTKEWRFTYTNIPASGTASVKVRFKELSSSTDNNLTDSAGWFTTLTRTVTTGSPANFRIQYPTNDGDTVSSTYQMKVYFNKALGQSSPGVDIAEALLIPEFSIYLASQISGDPEGEVFQPRATYGFIRNETGTESALTFTFPNLYNGDPNFLHHVRVEHQRGSVTLNDTRLVKAAVAAVTDSDNDGLPDYWESAHGLDRNNPDGDQGSAGDPDFDGVTNLQEFLFGLSPITQDSIPSLVIAPANPGLGITFPLITNRRYRLMTSTALGGWQPIGTYTSVTTAQNFTWNVNPADTRRFYRVEVSLP